MLSGKENNQDELLKKVRKHDADTGSCEVQIIALSKDILRLTEHFKLFPKDFGSKRGLMKKISRRKVFLNYLKKKDQKLFDKLVKELGIRTQTL